MAIRLTLKCGLLWYTVIIRKSLGLDGKKLLYGALFLFKFKIPKKKKHNYVSRFLLLVERPVAYLRKSSKRTIFVSITFNFS